MPNNGRITLCPFYRDEKNLSISCEDVFRRFRWKSQKERWLDKFCDKDWQDCPHAIELNEMYEKMGDLMNEKDKRLEELEHQLKAVKKELRKTATMLGKTEKRDSAKEQQIKEFRKKNRMLEKRYMEYSKKLAQDEKHFERMENQLKGIAGMYEGRLAYLISELGDGTFSENDFREWQKGKEYALTYDAKTQLYKAEVRECKEDEEYEQCDADRATN